MLFATAKSGFNAIAFLYDLIAEYSEQQTKLAKQSAMALTYDSEGDGRMGNSQASIIIYEYSDLKINNKNMNILLGDVEPPNNYYNDLELNYLTFNLLDYTSVEEIIREINEEIYGENLVTIPDPNKSYIVKIVSDFS